MKRVSIIMVNYNGIKYLGKKDLQDAIEGFLKTDYPDFEFIFVDNGSTDESVALAKDIFKKYPNIRTKIIVNKKNLGFAGGCNIGIRHAEGEYICLVNNDDKPLDNNWLKELVKVLESDKRIGAVCSVKMKWDSPTEVDAVGMTISPPGFVLGPKTSNYKPTKPIPVLIWQTPVLFRKSILKKIGGSFFDYDYIILHDDTDSSIRIWLAGYKILCVPTSIILHKRSATMKKLPVEFVAFHGRKNIIQTLIKCYELKNIVKYLPITIIIYLAFIFYSLKIRRIDQAKATFKALIWIIKNIKNIIIKRRIVQRLRKMPDSSIMKLMHPFSLVDLLRKSRRGEIWPK